MTHTNFEQSKTLLELGLKEETADLTILSSGRVYLHNPNIKRGTKETPCWSAEALLELLPEILFNDEGDETHLLSFKKEDTTTYSIEYNPYIDGLGYEEFISNGELLTVLIDAISWLIKNRQL